MSQAAAQDANSLVGKTLGGKYTLLDLLGEGAMGAVYSAETADGRIVAVKTLLAEARQQLGEEALVRFLREAQVSASVKSPNVVEVIDAGHDESTDVAFMVMELLQGEDLDQLLTRVAGALRPEVAARITAQAARGLAAAHAQGIVHRDVKPSNIFLHNDGGRVVVKVCDFGIAKGDKSSTQGLTVTGSVLGTPMYMSPEQLLNAKKVDHRADIWGLAMSTFDALVGEPALRDASNLPALVMALARQDVRTVASAASWVEPGLSKVVEAALQRDPEKRTPTMQAYLDAVLPFCGGSEDLSPDMLVALDPTIKQKVAQPVATSSSPPPRQGSLSGIGNAQLNPDRYVNHVIAKRYQIVRLLRSGLDGWIYEAKTTGSGRPCQLRLVHKGIVPSAKEGEALAERAKANREIRHPNLLRVLDAGIDPILALPYVVTEPYEGKSLAEVLAERGKLDERVAAGVFLHIARALGALHASGLRHGAVRPSAILFTERPGPDGQPATVAMLSGWGEAKLSYDAQPTSDDPEAIGPLSRYMAPEQARDSKEVTPRTDAWGLAISLFEALAGRNPLGGLDTMGNLILAICVQEIPRLDVFAPKASASLVDLVGRGLQRNADKRPPTMGDVEAILAPLAGAMARFPDPNEGATPAPPAAITPAPGGISPAVKAGVGLALLAVVAILAVALSR